VTTARQQFVEPTKLEAVQERSSGVAVQGTSSNAQIKGRHVVHRGSVRIT
jgi:hypothetical protein